MNKQLAILVTLFLCQTPNNAQILQFTSMSKGEGEIYHIIKPKLLDQPVAEYGRISSQYFAISDGGTNSLFTNYFLSKLLVETAARTVIDMMDNDGNSETSPFRQTFLWNSARYLDAFQSAKASTFDNFVEVVKMIAEKRGNGNTPSEKQLIQYLKSFNFFAELSVKDKATKLGRNSQKVHQYMLPGSATLVGGYLVDQQTENPKLRIFQIGNSLVAKFRAKRTAREKSLILLPDFITEDAAVDLHSTSRLSDSAVTSSLKDQSGNIVFNPSEQQRKANYKLLMSAYSQKLKEYEVDVTIHDVLVAGSNGLFDNISGPMLVILINYTVAVLEVVEVNEKLLKQFKANPFSAFENLIKEFLKKTSSNTSDTNGKIYHQQVERSQFEKLVLAKINKLQLESGAIQNNASSTTDNILEITDTLLRKSSRYTCKNTDSNICPNFARDLATEERFTVHRESANNKINRDAQSSSGPSDRQSFLNNLSKRSSSTISKIRDNFTETYVDIQEAPVDSFTKRNFRPEFHDTVFEQYTLEDTGDVDTSFIANMLKLENEKARHKDMVDGIFNDLRATGNANQMVRAKDHHLTSHESAKSRIVVDHDYSDINEDNDLEETNDTDNFEDSRLSHNKNKGLESDNSIKYGEMANQRLKFLQELKLLDCSREDYFDIGNSSQIPNVNTIKVSNCIVGKLKSLDIRQNLLPKHGYDILAKVLTEWAKRVMDNKAGRPSPESTKRILYGEDPEKVSDDNITVVATGLQNTNYQAKKSRNELSRAKSSIDEAFTQVQQTLTQFLADTVRDETVFKQLAKYLDFGV